MRTGVPDENDQPRFVEAGDSGPRRQKLEVRRHVYRQGGTPVRIKTDDKIRSPCPAHGGQQVAKNARS
jgi:hypothetical protein